MKLILGVICKYKMGKYLYINKKENFREECANKSLALFYMAFWTLAMNYQQIKIRLTGKDFSKGQTSHSCNKD